MPTATEKSTRIRGWKAIAEFFGVSSEATPRRWANGYGMPVHYGPGEPGRVYAFENELRAWETENKRGDVAI